MKVLLLLTLFFTVLLAQAEEGGRTADGCTYRIINGQYLTSCPSKASAPAKAPTANSSDSAALAAAAAPASPSPAGPVTSYGNVPVRHNSAANPPSLPPQQPVAAPLTARESSYEGGQEVDFAGRSESRSERSHAKWMDKTFAGVLLGASNMKESNAGSSTGIGLSLGTNIDETFGVELGYCYASQNLNLGLASRGANADQSQSQQANGAPSASDASLSSHLFTGEGQAYLTDPAKRLRPYVGAGLGWRSSTLSENNQSGYGSTAGGSLHQNAFGGLATAGTKLRISKAFQLGFAFRYFFPLARQDARLEQPATAYNADAPAESKLNRGDDGLTGSSQYQILGGLQYAF